jgi:aspartyl-tRNA(Asn)/glutamyl-tRNA(Gln) amidotransferase subunit A
VSPATIRAAADALRRGVTTSTALTRALLDRAQLLNETLGAFVTITAESAMAAAEQADRDFAAGTDAGPLQGIPIALKDIIATADAPTTANSVILPRDWGGCTDAPVAARLRRAGAVIIGKTTTYEFACGQPDPGKAFLIPRNPWNTAHTSSGSSSGTAISVVAGLALGAVGTDTAGSIRAPAAATGATGLKVSFGRVPKSGVVPLGHSLDTVGPMARTAYDCALLLAAMAGHDPSDVLSASCAVPSYADSLDGRVEGLRIGLPRDYFYDSASVDDEMRTAVLAAVDVLRDAGAIVREVDVPYAREASVANQVILFSEAFGYHRDNLIRRWGEYGRYTRLALIKGGLFTGGDYAQAQRVRTVFRGVARAVLDQVDVIITPGAPAPADLIASMDMQGAALGANFNRQWSLAGLPALAVPCGFSSAKLPLSMQIIGRPFAEADVLRVGDAYQLLTTWHECRPPIAAM